MQLISFFSVKKKPWKQCTLTGSFSPLIPCGPTIPQDPIIPCNPTILCGPIIPCNPTIQCGPTIPHGSIIPGSPIIPCTKKGGWLSEVRWHFHPQLTLWQPGEHGIVGKRAWNYLNNDSCQMILQRYIWQRPSHLPPWCSVSTEAQALHNLAVHLVIFKLFTIDLRTRPAPK